MKAQRRTSGHTLVEVLVASACMAILSAGLLVGIMSIQKSYLACSHHVTAQTQQMRLTDYMALDLRRASTVVTSGSTLTLTIPDYYAVDPVTGVKTPRMPTLSGGYAVYGNDANSPVVRYYQEGEYIKRSEGADPILTLCSDVQDFLISYSDSQNQKVAVSVTFLPRFQWTSEVDPGIRASG